jgi:F-type H+-transporting ATPase subunit gamma
MTARREIELHLKTLVDIRGIMSSMKTLALLETRKLTRRLATQSRVVDSIESAASDFRGFFPFTPSLPKGNPHVYLLLGSERGFCGDFNEALLEALLSALPTPQQKNAITSPLLVAVGHKLCSKLEGDPRIATLLDGASVAEEVDEILNRIVDALTSLQQQYGAFSLTALYHNADNNGIRTTRVLPPFQESPPSPRFGYPPRLTLEPEAFFAELLDHYLFAVLHAMAYTSLMAENRRRMVHLEGAIQHLEQDTAELSRKRNILRQEEITEEIEVIMLSVEAALATAD